MKVVISGTSYIDDPSILLEAVVDSRFEISSFVSAGNPGPERHMIALAIAWGIPYEIVSAEEGSHTGEALVAVWDGESRDTDQVLLWAGRKTKPIYIQRVLPRRYPGSIRHLRANERFVFGSNTAGIHGAGAAKAATMCWSACMGIGEGPTGRCYAIPSKDDNLRSLTEGQLKANISRFIKYARIHPELVFKVSKVGCGLAGFNEESVKYAFMDPVKQFKMGNLVLPEDWRE